MEGKNESKDFQKFYVDFASKISFLEFIHEEFKIAKIPVEELKKEISLLLSKKQWNVDDLSDYIKENPRSFIIFQGIFQLQRWTNAQLIHFIFDVARLNSLNIDAIYEYLILNLKYDPEFKKVYLKIKSMNKLMNSGSKDEGTFNNITADDKKYMVATFKFAILKYIDKIAKDPSILESRISKSEFADFSIRFSNYLISNLKLNEMLTTINVVEYLQNKRIPVDTKAVHGNYIKKKIIEVLERKGYVNIDGILKKNKVKTLGHDLEYQIRGLMNNKNNNAFCTEKYVEGVINPKNKKPKKFDMIIFDNYKPKYLFEMNFYSTEGTKIGINESEYIDLNTFIKDNFKDLEFCWITDGNYWLTPNGRKRFLNLLQHFNKVFNINTFAEYINNSK